MKQKTLQEQYNLISEGKGNKEVFMKAAKRQFPNIVRNAATLTETVASLKHGHIITEGISLGMGNSAKNNNPDWFKIFNENMNESKGDDEIASLEKEASKYKKDDVRYKELQKKIGDLKSDKEYALPGSKAAEKFSESLNEEVKAVEKKTSKEVTDLEEKNFDYKDESDVNNMNFEEFLRGYYTEMKNPKNVDKTEQELKDIVKKNLEKNPLFYVEDAQFGVEGIGYKEELPGLGKGKMVKDAGKGGGYGEATKKDFPEGDVGTGYLEIKENKESISLLSLFEGLPLGEKPAPKAKKKKVKKETTDSKLSEIEKNGKIATLEMQIDALGEIISSKNERISRVTEDEGLSELVDKKKMKEMQREVKLLEKKKVGMEKLYEKMCGKKYQQQEIVGETV